MTRRQLTLLAATGAAATFAASPEEAAVEKAERDWAAAAMKKDMAALKKLLGEELIYSHSDGRIETRAAYLAAMESGKQVYEKIEHESIAVKVIGTTAIVNAKAKLKVVIEGKATEPTLAMLHVYVKRGGQWQMVAHQSARLAG